MLHIFALLNLSTNQQTDMILKLIYSLLCQLFFFTAAAHHHKIVMLVKLCKYPSDQNYIHPKIDLPTSSLPAPDIECKMFF